jgi:hypothetical protein
MFWSAELNKFTKESLSFAIGMEVEIPELALA